jgi:hypothetical protein
VGGLAVVDCFCKREKAAASRVSDAWSWTNVGAGDSFGRAVFDVNLPGGGVGAPLAPTCLIDGSASRDLNTGGR